MKVPCIWFRVLLVAVLLNLTGCASKGTVSGRVTIEGVPLTSAVISFHSLEGNREVYNAVVRDGMYTIADLPNGKALVTVVNQGTPSKAGGDGKFEPGRVGAGSRVPPRYADPQTSDLRVLLQGKQQTFDVDLTP